MLWSFFEVRRFSQIDAETAKRRISQRQICVYLRCLPDPSMISHWRIVVNPGKNASCPKLFPIDEITQSMHGLCMATKTISIEIDAYELLKREKRSERESFSQVVRRLTSERPALTAAELEEAMKPFIGKGAGKKR